MPLRLTNFNFFNIPSFFVKCNSVMRAAALASLLEMASLKNPIFYLNQVLKSQIINIILIILFQL